MIIRVAKDGEEDEDVMIQLYEEAQDLTLRLKLGRTMVMTGELMW